MYLSILPHTHRPLSFSSCFYSGDILKIPSYRSFTLAESLLTSSRHRSSERKDSDVDFSHGKHFVQLSGGINDVSIQSAKQLPFSRLEGNHTEG